jgi:hypothetical protein
VLQQKKGKNDPTTRARMLLGHFSLRHIDEEFSSAGIKQVKNKKVHRYAKKPDNCEFWNVTYDKNIQSYCC